MIVQAATFVTLLGGGELGATDLDLAMARAPVLVAADGGADAALVAGRVPEAVIGDLDSLSEKARAEIGQERVYHIAEQDSTDFDKALRSIDAPGVIAVGFTGARTDHALAAYHTLLAHPAPPCIILGKRDIAFAAPKALTLGLPPRTRVSLFPLRPVTGRSHGLRWPIDGIEFAPGERIGTSNEAIADRVSLTFDRPGMLVILPRDHLDAAMAGLFQFPLSTGAAKR